MRGLRFLILASAVLLIGTTPGLPQFEGGRGGGRMRSRDPNEMFDRFANGKDVIIRSEITNPFAQGIFDRIAQDMGITSGQITREQFIAHAQQRMAQGAGGGSGPSGSPPAGGAPTPGTPGPGGAAPGSPGQGSPPPGGGGGDFNNPDNWSRWGESSFRRLDQNGDGVLNYDEMPEDLRSERDKWDTDHNGLLDLNEFKVYFVARMQQRMADWAVSGGPSPWDGQGGSATSTTPSEEDAKPVVYRSGKLPAGLPSWFQELDTDRDGQIGLYEWKTSGRPLEEFQRMDRNNDGFVTIQELVRYVAQNKQPGNQPPIAGNTAMVTASAAGDQGNFAGSRGGDFRGNSAGPASSSPGGPRDGGFGGPRGGGGGPRGGGRGPRGGGSRGGSGGPSGGFPRP